MKKKKSMEILIKMSELDYKISLGMNSLRQSEERENELTPEIYDGLNVYLYELKKILNYHFKYIGVSSNIRYQIPTKNYSVLEQRLLTRLLSLEDLINEQHNICVNLRKEFTQKKEEGIVDLNSTIEFMNSLSKKEKEINKLLNDLENLLVNNFYNIRTKYSKYYLLNFVKRELML